MSTWEIEAFYQDDTFHSLEWTQIEPRCKRLVNLSTFTQWTELVCTLMIGTWPWARSWLSNYSSQYGTTVVSVKNTWRRTQILSWNFCSWNSRWQDVQKMTHKLREASKTKPDWIHARGWMDSGWSSTYCRCRAVSSKWNTPSLWRTASGSLYVCSPRSDVG